MYPVLFNFLYILKLPAGQQQNSVSTDLTISRDQFRHQTCCPWIPLSEPVNSVYLPNLSGQQAPELHNTLCTEIFLAALNWSPTEFIGATRRFKKHWLFVDSFKIYLCWGSFQTWAPPKDSSSQDWPCNYWEIMFLSSFSYLLWWVLWSTTPSYTIAPELSQCNCL